MAQVHCLSTRGVMLDQCRADVDDLTEVMPGPEDWRNWALHASDELGQEILVMPFSSVLGWPALTELAISHAQSLRIPRHLRLRLDEAKTIWHELLGNIFSSYRPELHYMRGPGPKWRAKHRHEFGLIEFCGPGGHRYREHPAADRTAPVH
jgi:hypothetical protein